MVSVGHFREVLVTRTGFAGKVGYEEGREKARIVWREDSDGGAAQNPSLRRHDAHPAQISQTPIGDTRPANAASEQQIFARQV